MDSYAIDTKSCENKHTFFFKCPECDGFTATAMDNIPQKIWAEFVPKDDLDDLISKYNMANKK